MNSCNTNQLRRIAWLNQAIRLIASACLLATTVYPASAHAWSLRYIGQQILPYNFDYADTTVGGLSGIEFDPERGHFYVVSDDRSERNPARFYTMKLDLARFNLDTEPGHAGIRITSVTTLQSPLRQPYARGSADPEAIRRSSMPNRLIWSSEGNADKDILPSIDEIELNGTHVRSLPVPARFLPQGKRGTRDNRAFESLAVMHETQRLYVGTENALIQDGPAADHLLGSPCRIIAFDLKTGAPGVPQAEFVYVTDPVPVPPSLPFMFHTNGLVELLAADNNQLLALERAYTLGVGNSIRLYLIDLSQASDVSMIESLDGAEYRPVAKSLVLNLDSLGIPLDNIEGMSWGPRLSNGNRSLVFVSDNNFSMRQITQFLAFEVIP
jgi:hypothetical protein